MTNYSTDLDVSFAGKAFIAGLWQIVRTKSVVPDRTRAEFADFSEEILADIGAHDALEDRRAMQKVDARTMAYLMSLR